MNDLDKLSKKELIDLLNKKNQPIEQGFIQSNDYDTELEKIDRMATVANPHQIPYTQTSDHKNVMLYTALNKRVGPLHPDNARRTMIRWKKAGIQLYTQPRTEEQIEAFKTTDEYKVAKMKHDALRQQRRSQSSKGRTENMVKEIAAQTAKIVAGVK